MRMGTLLLRPAAAGPDSLRARLACDFGAKTALLAKPSRRWLPRWDRRGRRNWPGKPGICWPSNCWSAKRWLPWPGSPRRRPLCAAPRANTGAERNRGRQRGPLLRQLHDGLPESDRYDWYLDAWSADIAQAVRDLAARLAHYPPQAIAGIPAGGHDLFKPLYEALFPRCVAARAGRILHARLAGRTRARPGGLSRRSRQPALGPGLRQRYFLLAAVRRLRTAWEQSPAAATAAIHFASSSPPHPPEHRRLGPQSAGRDRPPGRTTCWPSPICWRTADRGRSPRLSVRCDPRRPESLGRPQQPFDFVVGNPPWIAWDNLPDDYRQATKPLWERTACFRSSANAGPARRRQERPLHADALRAAPIAT